MSKVSIEIMEPKGKLLDPRREGLSNPRLDTLNGKTIALMSIHVDSLVMLGSILFFDILEERLKARYEGLQVYRCLSFGSPASVVNADEIASKCDAWVEGVKEAITQGKRDVGVFMERAGKPGVSICSDVLLRSKQELQDLNGMPAVRLASVPAVDYCAAKRDRALMEKVVDAVFDDIVEALTKPLTEEEKRSYVKEYDYSNKTFTGETYHEAYEQFLSYCAANALTDGLPVVPPTPENVAWMMTGTTYDRDKVIGYMYPKRGVATVEKIAECAVMAGAKPEWLPVIIGIIDVITDPNFNQFHIVNEILPLIFISGPIVKELGINNTTGYLAPGYRINSTIGRAVLLCMISIGWRDMTVYASPGGPGQPAAYCNYLIPENQDESPWITWAEHCGFGPEESIITACELNGTSMVAGECMSNTSYEDRLNVLTSRFARNGGTYGFSEVADNPRYMIVLHPTLARQLADHGFTRETFIQYLYDKNVVDYERMTEEERAQLIKDLESEIAMGGSMSRTRALKPEDVKPGLHLEPFHTLDQVLVMVSGSGAGNSTIYSAMTGSSAPHAEDVKEPRAWMNKVIRGAALTKYGR